MLFVQPSERWESSTAPDRSRCKGQIQESCFYSFRMEVTGPKQEEQRGQAPFPAQHKASVQQDCPPRLGWELEQLPFCCSRLSYKAELQGNCTFCAANPSKQGPSSGAQPQTPKSKHRYLDSGMQPPCATPPSPAPVCDFFLVPVRRFFRKEARHTKYLQKWFIPLAFLQQKNCF